MRERKGFIYDQALIDTIIAMKELRPGDQVVMGPDPEHDTAADEEYLLGQVLVIDANGYVDTPPWLVGADLLGAPNKKEYGTYLTRKNIIAWRRPK